MPYLSLYVSILTRPGGRVQRCRSVRLVRRAHRFQSSPVPEDGCNLAYIYASINWKKFQSSPVPEDGCNEDAPGGTLVIDVSILTRPGGRVQHAAGYAVFGADEFQSSPVPEDGCNGLLQPIGIQGDGFQSSPVPEDGCNSVSWWGLR